MRFLLSLTLLVVLLIPTLHCGTGLDPLGEEITVPPPGPPGSTDASFGNSGAVTVDLDDRNQQVRALALQSDGKILVGGTHFDGARNVFMVARFKADGALDTEFGASGFALNGVSGQPATGSGLVVQSDGKIILCGTVEAGSDPNAPRGYALARFDTDGKIDTAYGTNGIRIMSMAGATNTTNGCVLSPLNSIRGVGSTAASSPENFGGFLATSTDFQLTMNDFGLAFGDRAFAVALDEESRAVAVGSATSGGATTQIAVTRFQKESPFLDLTFGQGTGFQLFGGAGNDAAHAVAISGGDIIVAGHVTDGEGLERFTVYRLDNVGTFARSLGRLAVVTPNFSEGHDRAYGVAVAGDGKIIAVGESNRTANGASFAIARMTKEGGLDTTFNGSGMKTLAIASGVNTARAVLVQPDGKIVVAGEAHDGNDYDVALVRLAP